jgi:peptidoglycan hydrolase CwlO-like protein
MYSIPQISNDYIDQINDFKATIRRLLDMIDTLKQTLDTVTASNRRNEELVKKLTAQIEQLQKMVKDLQDRNSRHNKHTFGKSSLKKTKRAEEKTSREESRLKSTSHMYGEIMSGNTNYEEVTPGVVIARQNS